MTNFITIAVLVCQMGASKMMLCSDKGTENLRDNEVKSSIIFQYYKCNDRHMKQCDLETKWDGCKFVMEDKSIAYSSFTCP